MTHYSLSWDEYKKSICNGLSSLQQNGEFVDMTLAADGHLVKVHQLIMALASPYIKQLISSANCPHPVIFLNKISYETLCSLLEYIYTGEVQIDGDKLDELLDAGRELHIKGLKDMKLHTSLLTNQSLIEDLSKTTNDAEFANSEIDNTIEETHLISDDYHTNIDDYHSGPSEYLESDTLNEDNHIWVPEVQAVPENVIKVGNTEKKISAPLMQYTVSNQGRLQMILNRYMYYLKYTNKNRTQQWRCIDYLNQIKCPAYLFTKGEAVVQRVSLHIHPFHDKKILKKVRSKAVYSAIHEAQQTCVEIKKNRGNQNEAAKDVESIEE